MLRLIPIGGMGTVTKNMYVYEEENQILIVDCGIGFPDASMLGVDILIPDVSYLQKRKEKIVGMLLTHGHDDHIAGLPYILPKLGPIPIYASRLTRGFAENRLKEFKVTARMNEIGDQPFSVGSFQITPIKVTHSVPDARHFAIKTKVGTIYHGSDFKFDNNPVDGVISEIDKISSLGREGILCLLSDCLRSEKKGHSLSESLLADSFEREIKNIRGRFIVTLMSSNVHRIQQAVNAALKVGRKIAFVGRSVESNVKTAMELGFLKIPREAIISRRQIKKFAAHKLAIIIAGSQGQEGSSLQRVSAGEHQLLKIRPEDKIVFASDPIPGNENPVYSLIDNFSRLGAEVAYSDIKDALHVSGHAYSQEQQELIKLTRPKFLIPIGGTYRHMVRYRQLARDLGYKDQQVLLLEDGQVVNFQPNRATIAETIPIRTIMVDGLGVGDVGSVVLRDRQNMADDGIVVVVVPIEKQTGKLRGNTEVISRGFVFMKKSKQLIGEIEAQVRKSLTTHKGMVTDWLSLRRKIEKQLEKFLYQKTKRRPLILTVIMEV